LQDGASSLFDPEMFKKVDVRELFDDAADEGRAAAAAARVPKKVISDKEWEAATAGVEDEQEPPPTHPTPRTNRTHGVPRPVLIGHTASLAPY